MTADDLAAAARALYGPGHGAMKRLADALGVSYDSLRHVLAGRRSMPEGWVPEVARLLSGAPSAGIAPPPATLRPEDDRDGPCGEALDPHLDNLARLAEAAGWHPAEVAAAILTWATHRIAAGAGPDAAVEALRDAQEIVRLRA